MTVARATLTTMWTQGLRMLDEPSVSPMSWQHLLYRRLSNQHNAIPPAAATAAAEVGLGLGRNAYWYIGRVEPDFGQIVCVHLADTASDTRIKVNPFDTGGLWHGHIQTDPPLDAAQRVTLVASTQLDIGGYDAQMRSWLAAAYGSPPTSYPTGGVPSVSTVPVVTLPPPNEPRSWTWEGRIPVAVDASAAMPAWGLFITNSDRDAYLQWLLARPH
jgi:hypothetical protein